VFVKEKSLYFDEFYEDFFKVHLICLNFIIKIFFRRLKVEENRVHFLYLFFIYQLLIKIGKVTGMLHHKVSTAMSQLWLYEYMFQMWRIDPYVLCIRTFNHI
jgi:hypothetical protein